LERIGCGFIERIGCGLERIGCGLEQIGCSLERIGCGLEKEEKTAYQTAERTDANRDLRQRGVSASATWPK
jgi:hypothetical protein